MGKIIAKVLSVPNKSFAAMDLGTNACRLLIAQKDVANNKLIIIDSFSRPVKLGEGLVFTKLISEESERRTINALKVCSNIIKKHNVAKIRAVATYACREAGNSLDFIKNIYNQTGINFEIISADEEANLAIKSCISLADKNFKYAIAFDIGGGSTQIAFIKIIHNNKNNTDTNKEDTEYKIIENISIPVGVVTIKDTLSCNNIKKSEKIIEWQKKIKKHLNKFKNIDFINENIEKNKIQQFGINGTITTLTASIFGLKEYKRNKVDGSIVSTNEILNECDQIINITIKRKIKNSKKPSYLIKNDLMGAGCIILKTICENFKTNQITVADRGIREGILKNILNIL